MGLKQPIKLPHDPVYPVDDLFESLERYLNHGIMPGGFLTAVLENNLLEAVSRADTNNIGRIREIVNYIYFHFPVFAWGSRKHVASWLQHLREGKQEE